MIYITTYGSYLEVSLGSMITSLEMNNNLLLGLIHSFQSKHCLIISHGFTVNMVEQ